MSRKVRNPRKIKQEKEKDATMHVKKILQTFFIRDEILVQRRTFTGIPASEGLGELIFLSLVQDALHKQLWLEPVV